MSRLPRPTGKEVMVARGKIGFRVSRIKGRHHFLRHADGRTTVVPVHRGETLGPGLLAKILHDCEIDRETLASLL